MAKPWEKFQTAETASGPWSKFQTEAAKPEAKKEERSTLRNLAEGFAGGIGDAVDTVWNVATAIPGKIAPALAEFNDERSQGLKDWVDERKDSTAFQVGRVGGNIAATLPVGPILGTAAQAVKAPAALATAIRTGGMRAGATPGAVNMLTRMAGGGITGGAAAGLVNPESAGTGAAIGAALPPVISGAGRIGSAIGQRMTTQVPESVRQTVAAARDAGYVIPPTQAKPTMTNKLLEGFAGKISTAQNASARNQNITNELAKRAIGADDLSMEGLAQVRRVANSAYDELARVGQFQADDAFRESLRKAGASSSQLRKDFPELVNAEVDNLIEGLSSRGTFDSQSVIEAIKRLRFDGSANRAGMDPAKKALGKAQMSIANSLEELVDRNLQAQGQQGLLKNYRDARQTLAKVYDIEKALNPASGNVDAKKIAALLNKGRPLTGEMRTIGEFASQFPTAAKMTESMGSLPQMSPLDFASMGTLSAITQNPLMMAGVFARPAARKIVLSGPVQNRLASAPGSNRLLELMGNPAVGQLTYRSAPAVAASR